MGKEGAEAAILEMPKKESPLPSTLSPPQDRNMPSQNPSCQHTRQPSFSENDISRNSPVSKHSVGKSLAKRKQLAGGGPCIPNIDSPLCKAELLICPKGQPSNCREGLELEQAGIG